MKPDTQDEETGCPNSSACIGKGSITDEQAADSETEWLFGASPEPERQPFRAAPEEGSDIY